MTFFFYEVLLTTLQISFGIWCICDTAKTLPLYSGLAVSTIKFIIELVFASSVGLPALTALSFGAIIACIFALIVRHNKKQRA